MQSTDRVVAIREHIRAHMLRERARVAETGSLFADDPDCARLPLILRNARAVRMRLATVPLALWPGQLVAGSVVLPDTAQIIADSLPDYATPEEKRAAAAEGYSVGSIVGHIVPSYPKLLRMGAQGIRDDALVRMRQASGESRAFHEACAIAMDALCDFADRYAAHVSSLAESERDAVRARELRDMAEDLRRSPRLPPRRFSQAVQAIWLTHLAFQLTGNHLAIGRFDQHVWPYLERDLASCDIDMARAQELVDCFFLKFNERSIHNALPRQVTDFEAARERNERTFAERSPFAHSTQRFNARDSVDASNHWLQNVILGGVRPEDGEDATNPVTYLCLNAFDQNRMTNPCLTLRLSSGTPEALYARACEVLREGGGLPAFFNDDAIIPALVRWGIPLADARDYTNDGCWEIILAGRNDFYFDRFNMLRCLEWALHRGTSLIDGKREAPDPGDAAAFDSFEAVYDAFLRELTYVLDGLIDKNERQFGKRYAIAPVPLLSALLEGPPETGADMTLSGAKCITYGLIGEGASHVIDSLAAIRHVVFERREADMAQLLRALREDYAGHEALRQKLLAAPKYGRNDRAADDIAARLFRDFAAHVESRNPGKRITYLPGAGTFSWYIAIGEGCGASADGRRAREEVASNLSPSAGAATRGVTGAILSHAALNMRDLPVGSPTDLRLAGKLVAGEAGLGRLIAVVKSFVALGANMLTLTIADTRLLREAQAHPERHRDLRVRMGGWSAYFTMLSPEQQEHHIRKQEEV